MGKKGGKKRFSMDDVDFQDSYTYDMDDEYGYSGDKKDKKRNREKSNDDYGDYGYHDDLNQEDEETNSSESVQGHVDVDNRSLSDDTVPSRTTQDIQSSDSVVFNELSSDEGGASKKSKSVQAGSGPELFSDCPSNVDSSELSAGLWSRFRELIQKFWPQKKDNSDEDEQKDPEVDDNSSRDQSPQKEKLRSRFCSLGWKKNRKSPDDSDASQEECDRTSSSNDSEHEGEKGWRRWLRIGKGTVVVTLIVSILMATGYIVYMFRTGQKLGGDNKAVIAASEKGGMNVKSKKDEGKNITDKNVEDSKKINGEKKEGRWASLKRRLKFWDKNDKKTEVAKKSKKSGGTIVGKTLDSKIKATVETVEKDGAGILESTGSTLLAQTDNLKDNLKNDWETVRENVNRDVDSKENSLEETVNLPDNEEPKNVLVSNQYSVNEEEDGAPSDNLLTNDGETDLADSEVKGNDSLSDELYSNSTSVADDINQEHSITISSSSYPTSQQSNVSAPVVTSSDTPIRVEEPSTCVDNKNVEAPVADRSQVFESTLSGQTEKTVSNLSLPTEVVESDVSGADWGEEGSAESDIVGTDENIAESNTSNTNNSVTTPLQTTGVSPSETSWSATLGDSQGITTGLSDSGNSLNGTQMVTSVSPLQESTANSLEENTNILETNSLDLVDPVAQSNSLDVETDSLDDSLSGDVGRSSSLENNVHELVTDLNSKEPLDASNLTEADSQGLGSPSNDNLLDSNVVSEGNLVSPLSTSGTPSLDTNLTQNDSGLDLSLADVSSESTLLNTEGLAPTTNSDSDSLLDSNEFGSKVSQGLNEMSRQISGYVDNLSSSTSDLSDHVAQSTQNFQTNVQNRLSSAEDKLNTGLGAVQNLESQTVNNLSQTADSLTNSLTGTIDSVENGLRSSYNNTTQAISDVYNSVADSLKDTGNHIQTNLQSIGNSLGNQATNEGNTVLDDNLLGTDLSDSGVVRNPSSVSSTSRLSDDSHGSFESSDRLNLLSSVGENDFQSGGVSNGGGAFRGSQVSLNDAPLQSADLTQNIQTDSSKNVSSLSTTNVPLTSRLSADDKSVALQVDESLVNAEPMAQTGNQGDSSTVGGQPQQGAVVSEEVASNATFTPYVFSGTNDNTVQNYTEDSVMTPSNLNLGNAPFSGGTVDSYYGANNYGTPISGQFLNENRWEVENNVNSNVDYASRDLQRNGSGYAEPTYSNNGSNRTSYNNYYNRTINSNFNGISGNIYDSNTTSSGLAGRTNLSTNVNTGYREYITKEGDNLLTIAENELGSSSRWSEIKRLNNLRSGATYFEVGTTIKLPVSPQK